MKCRKMFLVFATLIIVLSACPAAVSATAGPEAGVSRSNGTFTISVRADDGWVEIGTLSYDRFVSERSIELPSPMSEGDLRRIRITQTGGGAAHIDAVTLGGAAPLGIEGVEDPLAVVKLSTRDFDVIDAFGRTMVLTFPDRPGAKTLSLVARVGSTVISREPFRYPLSNLFTRMTDSSEFYTCSLKEILTTAEGQWPELFREYYPSGSGHPSGFTIGRVGTDGENLLVDLDFTADNTMDGDKDYAAVYAKTPDSVRKFRVSTRETRWGSPAFTYTKEVPYQHKVYRFRIPLTELGVKQETEEGPIRLAFAAYGTATPAGSRFNPVVAYDSVNDRYLAAYVQYMNPGWALKTVLADNAGAEIQTATISNDVSFDRNWDVAFDDDNERFLVVWGEVRDGSGYEDLYGQFVANTGAIFGSNIAISVGTNYQDQPAVAYDTATNRYLVAWYDNRNADTTQWADVYAQFIEADGTLVDTNGVGGPQPFEDNFSLVSRDRNQQAPDVAWDPVSGNFLVVWEDWEFSNVGSIGIQVRGSILDSTGTAVKADFRISEGAIEDERYPRAAFDRQSQRYVVVWEDNRAGVNDPDVYGQLVSSTGDLLTTGGTIGADNIPIATGSPDARRPDVTALGSTAGYFVAWSDDRNDPTTGDDVIGQRLDGSGTLSGQNRTIYASTFYDALPTLALNESRREIMAVFRSGNDIAFQTVSIDKGGGGGGGGCNTTGPASGNPVWPEGLLIAILGGGFLLWRRVS